jgi:prepilin peptidase CpaA
MIYRHFNLTIDTALVVWVLTLAFTFWAAWLDWRTRRIPNWLTVPGFILGIGVHSLIGGWHGALGSLEGAGMGLLILFPMVVLRGLGAGDWKLMGAVGALLGVWGVLLAVLFVSALVSGLMAVITVIRAHRIVATLRNMVVLVQGFFVFGWHGNPEITLDNPGLLTLPFGVAAAIATLICFVASRWVR